MPLIRLRSTPLLISSTPHLLDANVLIPLHSAPDGPILDPRPDTATVRVLGLFPANDILALSILPFNVELAFGDPLYSEILDLARSESS